jgi:hypothetical protein
LFAELPVKLLERKNSSHSAPVSRKRPNPGPEVAAQKANQSVPNMARPTDPHVPDRASSFPNTDMAARQELRKVPNSAGVRAAINDKLFVQAGPWDSKSTPMVAADAESTSQTLHGEAQMPRQQATCGPQLANNLPDLRGLMYPSPNPFAYGNQPLSILEDTQMISSEPQFPFVGPTTAFGISSNETEAHGMPFYNLGNSLLDNSGQPVMYQQIQNGSVLGPSPNRVDFQYPQASSVQDMRNVNRDEELWQQWSKGRTGRTGRTGLTPGLNLDELFGSDGGWNAGYMDQGFSRTQ